jgi:hypothetical protein
MNLLGSVVVTSELAGEISYSLGGSVARAALEDCVPYRYPIYKSKEVKLLCA